MTHRRLCVFPGLDFAKMTYALIDKSMMMHIVSERESEGAFSRTMTPLVAAHRTATQQTAEHRAGRLMRGRSAADARRGFLDRPSRPAACMHLGTMPAGGP